MAAGERVWLAVFVCAMVVVAAVPGSAQIEPSSAGATADPGLLQSIETQAPSVVDPGAFQVAVEMASATKVWLEQDAVVRSWPKYPAVRDAIRQELSQTLDLDKATVDQLREEAARLRAVFWSEEGCLLPDGYRHPYQARVLLEIALARAPGDLSLQDDLVETIQTANPLDCYDPDVKDRTGNREMVVELRTLRTLSYAQTKAEVEGGRPFTWEDFARVGDFVSLWSALDTPKAIEAFEWALSQAGLTAGSSGMPYYLKKVSKVLRGGGGVSFHVYDRTRAIYPHDYLYVRRLPAFRGPDPEGKGLKPILKIPMPTSLAAVP